jgi:hypothetical protein
MPIGNSTVGERPVEEKILRGRKESKAAENASAA